MTNSKIYLPLFILVFTLPVFLVSQTTLSSGGEIINLPGGGTLQTTIGETIICTIENENNVFTHGQQQPDPLEFRVIPTLGEWSIILLSQILLIFGLVSIKCFQRENIKTSRYDAKI